MNVLSHHRMITDECRANKGDDGALDEAAATAREAVRKLYQFWPAGKGAVIHIKVEVSYPSDVQ